MSVTTRLFVCEQADLERLRSRERDGDSFEGSHPANGVTDLHLYMIWAAIDGCEWDPDTHSGETLTDGERAIVHVPPAMVSAFASVTDADAKRIALQLAPSEDFGWEVAEVSKLVSVIRDFAMHAQDRQVFLEVAL
jgi:hypothetical protein